MAQRVRVAHERAQRAQALRRARGRRACVVAAELPEVAAGARRVDELAVRELAAAVVGDAVAGDGGCGERMRMRVGVRVDGERAGRREPEDFVVGRVLGRELGRRQAAVGGAAGHGRGEGEARLLVEVWATAGGRVGRVQYARVDRYVAEAASVGRRGRGAVRRRLPVRGVDGTTPRHRARPLGRLLRVFTSPRSVLVVRVLLHVQHAQSLGLLHERPLLDQRKGLPLAACRTEGNIEYRRKQPASKTGVKKTKGF